MTKNNDLPNRQTGLNPAQKEAVDHKDGPILIAAGAGSGKTHTLTNRLKKLVKNGVKPENILAITFTNKAANEMRERVFGKQEAKNKNQGPLFIGTFHSLGARILKKESKLVERTPTFTIFDSDDSLSLIKKLMKEADIDKEQYSPTLLQNKISTVKNEMIDPGEYLDKIALRIFEKYEASLIKNNGFDFDDLIEKVAKIFETHPQILEKYQNEFRYILVDEYQDVNPSQYKLVRLLAQKHQNLSVVGDDAQSIYGFRGSDFRNFLNFEQDWPNAKIVKLEQNYRSAGNIITAASAVIKNNKFQKPKDLWTENPAGSLIKIVGAESAEEEASWIADAIQKLAISNSQLKSSRSQITNYQLPITAVLYRTNAQSRSIEQEFIVRQIPYKIFGGLKFYERKEVKDIVAALRIAFNPQDSLSAERISKTFNKDVAAYLNQELPRLGKELTILELINFFLKNSHYFEYLDKHHKNSKERQENVNELINFASGFKNLGEFLERVSLLQSADSPAKQSMINGQMSVVNLMSVHLAKGLEFGNVFVIGCNEGLIPHQMSYGSQDELEEERRLMYVAMTRAKKELCLSFFNIPSRFLYEIPPELTETINLSRGKKELPDEDEMYLENF